MPKRSVKALNIKETKRQVQLREWVMQVSACKKSGLPVRQWCQENGVAIKSYYYHLKRVREELLDVMDTENKAHMLQQTISDGTSIPARSDLAVRDRNGLPISKTGPVFAALPVPQNHGAAVTVRIGGFAIDIQNGADSAVVEQVLSVVAGL